MAVETRPVARHSHVAVSADAVGTAPRDARNTPTHEESVVLSGFDATAPKWLRISGSCAGDLVPEPSCCVRVWRVEVDHEGLESVFREICPPCRLAFER